MSSFESIALVKSPYKEKFAVPRQPGLVTLAKGKIEFLPDFDDASMLDGLEAFSHLWLIFQFHKTQPQGWSPKVRPPRLGGNQKVGLLATRSPFRPNSLGLSVVKLESVNQGDSPISLTISQFDLVDGTPILDIKPYLPYADAIPEASAGFAEEAPSVIMQTRFSQTANQVLQQYRQTYPDLATFIMQVLAQDPRPAYHKNKESEREYGVHLEIFNVRWQVKGEQNYVTEIEVLHSK